MKVLFSEALPDYENYVFPYAVWAFPENEETPADFLERGFLPSSKNLDRFYLCRSVRVALARFAPSSENRRILRKGGDFQYQLLPKAQFDFTPAWRDFCLQYAAQKFGREVMSKDRLSALAAAPVTSHFMVFRDAAADRDAGLVMMFLQPPRAAQYYYAFYDLNYAGRSLGMYMMTSAVLHFAQQGFQYLYLGSCYAPKALYKTQFEGAEFFNGACWSRNLDELKYLIARSARPQTQHLFEAEEYLRQFYHGDLGRAAEKTMFALTGR